jgi:hypothetical protein
MNKEEVLQYLTEQIDLLQKRAIDLQAQHDDVEKQLKAYKQLVKMYRGVYESEAGVGLQNRLPAEILEILEKKFGDEEAPLRNKPKRRRYRRTK